MSVLLLVFIVAVVLVACLSLFRGYPTRPTALDVSSAVWLLLVVLLVLLLVYLLAGAPTTWAL